MIEEHSGIERFKVMEKKLYRGIAMPSMILTLASGICLLYTVPGFLSQGWMHAKLTCILILVAYQLYCGHLKNQFAMNRNTKSHYWYRIFNEVPAVFLCIIIVLVIVKPF